MTTQDERYSIFLSHHETETDLAQAILQFLQSTSQSININTFVQRRRHQGSFRQWIIKSVMSADMYIFLYTDDTRELSWVAHELGIYVATRAERDMPAYVVCLRSNDIARMPEVMSDYPPIAATKVKIQIFLEDLLVKGKYSEGNRLGNDYVREKDLLDNIENEAEELASMFRSKIYTQYYADRLIIRNIVNVKRSEYKGDLRENYQIVRQIPNPENGEPEEYVVDFAPTVIEASENVRNYMGLSDKCRWADLIFISDRTGSTNRFNIAQDIIQHASSESFQGAKEMMLSEMELNGKIVRPIISRIEKRDRLPVTYYTLLIPDEKSRSEEIGEHNDQSHAFDMDMKLVLLLSTARKFRWNVVEPYIWRIRRAVREKADLTHVLEEFMTELNGIELESQRNKIDDGALASLLFPKESRDDLQELWLGYFEIRKQLDESVQNQDVNKILEILIEFQKMNRNFMKTGLEVYKTIMVGLPTLEEADPNWRNG